MHNYINSTEDEFHDIYKIDIGIREVIQKLNKMGYKTRYSCSSHFDEDLPLSVRIDRVDGKTDYYFSQMEKKGGVSYDTIRLTGTMYDKYDEPGIDLTIENDTYITFDSLPIEKLTNIFQYVIQDPLFTLKLDKVMYPDTDRICQLTLRIQPMKEFIIKDELLKFNTKPSRILDILYRSYSMAIIQFEKLAAYLEKIESGNSEEPKKEDSSVKDNDNVLNSYYTKRRAVDTSSPSSTGSFVSPSSVSSSYTKRKRDDISSSSSSNY